MITVIVLKVFEASMSHIDTSTPSALEMFMQVEKHVDTSMNATNAAQSAFVSTEMCWNTSMNATNAAQSAFVSAIVPITTIGMPTAYPGVRAEISLFYRTVYEEIIASAFANTTDQLVGVAEGMSVAVYDTNLWGVRSFCDVTFAAYCTAVLCALYMFVSSAISARLEKRVQGPKMHNRLCLSSASMLLQLSRIYVWLCNASALAQAQHVNSKMSPENAANSFKSLEETPESKLYVVTMDYDVYSSDLNEFVEISEPQLLMRIEEALRRRAESIVEQHCVSSEYGRIFADIDAETTPSTSNESSDGEDAVSTPTSTKKRRKPRKRSAGQRQRRLDKKLLRRVSAWQ
jgi:hypothetical protein